ncbi:MAG: RNA polymerase sigma factor [Actinomycetota bacterium]
MEGRPLDDAELAERARNGDVDAYESLVARYQQIAHRVAYLITRSSSDADDAAQEAFVKAYYALDRFRSGASFKPWLLTIVSNEARNRRRSSTRRLELAERAASVRPSGDAAPSPEVAAIATEERRMLLDAVDRLREQDRLVVIYRYFLDLSEQEMAEILDCPRGTVKSRLSRALARLKEELGDALDLGSISVGGVTDE